MLRLRTLTATNPHVRFILVLLFVTSCGASHEFRYTATYSDSTTPSELGRLAFEAIVGEGYRVSAADQYPHTYQFITVPTQTAASQIEIVLVVQLVYQLESATKMTFNVAVIPRAFNRGQLISDEHLPSEVTSRARALSSAIRKRARKFESPR